MPVFLIRVAASVILLFGLITFPLPLPTGLVAIVLAMAMFASTSATLLGKLKALRRRYRFVDEKLESIKPFVPASIQRTIHESRPSTGEDADADSPPGRETQTKRDEESPERESQTTP